MMYRNDKLQTELSKSVTIKARLASS